MLCTAKTRTISIGDQHRIRKFDANQRNYAPQANKPQVLKSCAQMKELARISSGQPAQITANVMGIMSCEIYPCLPRKDVLRRQTKRVKCVGEEEIEPKTLNDCK